MSDVHICHQKIVIADPRKTTATLRASMDVHVFAKYVVIADRKEGVFTFEFKILRLKPDRTEGIKLIVLSNRRRAFDDDVRLEAASFADLHTRADPAKRADRHIIGNLGFGTDNRGLVNHGCCPTDESSVASAASSEPT